jgi:NhaP-type Na+/H+ or K+/H+ antiporter
VIAWAAVALLSEYDLSKAFTFLEGYDLALLVLGLSILAASVLPRLLFDKPLTLPMVLLALGFAVFALPLGLEFPDPLEQGKVTERLTELGVIVALMGAGLKLDRPPHWLTWRSTWLLLGISMPLTIAAAALLGWWVAGFVPATAMLLGAVIAPTDPVLATEVQVGAPGAGYDDPAGEEEDEVRFSLTAEAGLNDGLAFPFTYMAIAMAVAGPAPGNWIGSWLLVNVFYKLGVGFVVGLLLGWVLARTILAFPAATQMAKAITGLSSLASILLVYGATEYAGGYGFIAVFVAAVAMRNYERDHEYQESLHIFTEQAERLLTAGIVLALGGAIAGGILAPLTWQLALVGVLLVFVVRPLAGMIGLVYLPGIPWRERAAISFFGIRGIGSLYYLSYALNEAEFPGKETLWALVAFVVMLSIIIHGLTGVSVMSALDRHREQLLREQGKKGP